LLVLPRTAAPLRMARHERVARSAAIAAEAERLQPEHGAQRQPVVRAPDGGAGRNVVDPELLQNSSSCRAAATTRSTDGMYASSIFQYGYGTSKPVTRSTGPRRSRIAFSARIAASSPAKPFVRGASCTITTRPVLAADA